MKELVYEPNPTPVSFSFYQEVIKASSICQRKPVTLLFGPNSDKRPSISACHPVGVLMCYSSLNETCQHTKISFILHWL